MKKLAVLLIGMFMTASSFAQTIAIQPPQKKIEVTGSAEIEITPDEITVNITLREYYKGKNNTNKVGITTLEQQLQKAVQDAGIAKENFTIANVFGYNADEWWKKKKNDPEFLARKQYSLKVSRLDKINAILAAVDEEGIESVNIASYTSSKMEEYRKQVKMSAIKAAKTKAEYMLSALDAKIGGVLEVQEFSTDNYSDVRPEAANVMMSARAFDKVGGVPDSNIDFRKIKVRAEVRTVFEIAK